MKRKMLVQSKALVQSLLALMCVGMALCGCQSKQFADERTASYASPSSSVSGPEKVSIEKLAGPMPPDAAQLVSDYNSRDFGSPGWRRVSLELMTEGKVTRSFNVLNLWRAEASEVRTLFILEKPEGLSGTNYLLQENTRQTPDMLVQLFLPAGERRVLEVAPGNFSEGLLGSDFGYNDVRMQLPVKGYRYKVVGQATLLSEPVWVLEVEPASTLSQEICSWKLARLYLMRKVPFLLGADYFDAAGVETGVAQPFKQMRVESLTQLDGVLTATRITTYATDKRASVLTLQDARFKLQEMDKRLFSTTELPAWADRIRQGWKPESLCCKN